MRVHAIGIAVLVVALAYSALAAAAAIPATELYRDGRYEEGIAAGLAQGDGEGLAVAAEAALAIATLADTPCDDCLKRAEAYARKAVATDADNARSYVTLVATLAYKSRLIGTFAARRAGYAAETKRLLASAQSLAPDDPWTLAALGGWNIEVIRAAGPVLGRVLYGADFERGHDFFSRAVAADPRDPLIAYHFALALASYDFEQRRSEIAALLEAASHGQTRDAYGVEMKGRAARLFVLLTQGKNSEFYALARHFLGFPD